MERTCFYLTVSEGAACLHWGESSIPLNDLVDGTNYLGGQQITATKVLRGGQLAEFWVNQVDGHIFSGDPGRYADGLEDGLRRLRKVAARVKYDCGRVTALDFLEIPVFCHLKVNNKAADNHHLVICRDQDQKGIVDISAHIAGSSIRPKTGMTLVGVDYIGDRVIGNRVISVDIYTEGDECYARIRPGQGVVLALPYALFDEADPDMRGPHRAPRMYAQNETTVRVPFVIADGSDTKGTGEVCRLQDVEHFRGVPDVVLEQSLFLT